MLVLTRMILCGIAASELLPFARRLCISPLAASCEFVLGLRERFDVVPTLRRDLLGLLDSAVHMEYG